MAFLNGGHFCADTGYNVPIMPGIAEFSPRMTGLYNYYSIKSV